MENCRGIIARNNHIEGIGPDTPTVTNEHGGKQSDSQHRCDLLPARAVLAIAKVLNEGSRKYGDNNWRRIPRREHLNHALTHLFALLADDAQDDHLSHAACRLLFAMETQ